jgi:hypothetical protein
MWEQSMSDVLSFRIARPPQRSTPDPAAVLYVKFDADPFPIDDINHLRRAAAGFVNSAGFVRKGSVLDTSVRELDEWLVSVENEPSLSEFDDELLHLVKKVADAPPASDALAAGKALVADRYWALDRSRIVKSLIASAVAVVDMETSAELVRLMLIIGLVEYYAEHHRSVVTAKKPSQEILRLLRDRIVALPSPPFPLPLRSTLVRRPAFSDLYVVRDEWSCYVPGEIAHIENVLKGELKERLFKQTTETETTTVTETETRSLKERDTQTTDRFDHSDEGSRDTQLTVGVDGQVDTSGQYGPTHVDTHIGGRLDYSLHDSNRHATQQAHESVARAITRVEQSVREARTVRTLTRTEETDDHTLNNVRGPGHVTGVYRWVDKIQRLQLFRYPHRFLLEFEVPEPGSYLRWLHLRDRDRGFRTPEPPPLTIDGKLGVDGKPSSAPLTPLLITEGNYLDIAERYFTLGVTPPPPDEIVVNGWLYKPAVDPSTIKTSVQLWQTPAKGAAEGTAAAGAADGESVSVPDGYEATSWSGHLLSWDQDDKIGPGWNKSANASYKEVPPILFVTLGDNPGGDPAVPTSAVAADRSAIDRTFGGAISAAKTGTLPITVMAANDAFVSIYVHVHCTATGMPLLKWQFDTFEKIEAAYFALKRQHEEEKAARAISEGIQIDGDSPTLNKDLIRKELRRQVVELLIGEGFAGRSAIKTDPTHPEEPPHIDHAKLKEVTPGIQFLEQAFEWNNMTYVLYPYYWAAAAEWPDLLEIKSTDPDFAEFLSSGSARVILPARPGFENAVYYFTVFEQPWGGGPAPVPGEPLYISVAQEIQAQKQAPDDGEPSDSWEVKLPTTLVWLDPDAAIPKKNPRLRLTKPKEELCRDN